MSAGALVGVGLGVVGLIITFAGMMVALGRVLQALDTVKESLAKLEEKSHKQGNAITELTVSMRLAEQSLKHMEKDGKP